MIRSIPLCALLAALAVPTLAAAGPSAFGCERLEEATPTPYLEGRDGVFFRLANDLRLLHPISEGSVDLVARLSRALEARGTTLVFVPLPSKGLAMPGALPPEASAYGFDHAVAADLYEDGVTRLREAGVIAVDALAPMLALPEGETAFIPADHHWSSAGARAVAAEVAAAIAAAPGYADLAPIRHETRALGFQEVPSPLRRDVQSMCRATVPASGTEAHETVVLPADDALEGGRGGGLEGGIFAAEAAGPDVVLVGTSMSRTPTFNFDGFIAQAASLDVVNYAMIGGNQFGAITSYLLSEDYRQAPPRFLVWENPVYNNLAQFGEQPLREAIAAVLDDCAPLATERLTPDTLAASMPDGGLAAPSSIRADAGAAPGLSATFGFVTADGARVAATIRRSDRQEPTARFYQSMQPLWEPGISRVEVRFDRPVGDDATLAVCDDQESAS